MKLRLIIFVLPLTLLFEACKFVSLENVTIKGNFTNLPGQQLYLYQILPNNKPLIDSALTDGSGNFEIGLKVEKAGFYTLRINPANEITLVVLPDEKITLSGDGKALSKTYKVEGSKESQLFAEYNAFTGINLSKVDSLAKIFTESRSEPGFESVKAKLDSAYIRIFENQKEKVIAFIHDKPNSLASLLAISSDFGPNPLLSEHSHPDLFIKLDSALMVSYPENSLVNSFHLRMLDFKAELADLEKNNNLLKPGMPAREIILPNSDGKNLTLSKLKGKLTLVYFWSSWNALSRQTNMKLAPIYNQYHNRGFEIFAVSIDSDSDLWQKAYLLDKAYWIHVHDATGLESEYCKTYAVRQIPKMILVGKEGNIIEANARLVELESLIRSNL
ncbi:MAG: thioredoxin-like domain-containing protein [Bacteroidales bacterium]